MMYPARRLAVNDRTCPIKIGDSESDYLRRSEHAKVIGSFHRKQPNSNRFIVGRSRRFVWAHDQSQTAFIEKHMSMRMEAAPLFPGIGHYAVQQAQTAGSDPTRPAEMPTT
jgi:hypothetical protein